MCIQPYQFNQSLPDKELLKKIKIAKKPGTNIHGIDEILDTAALGISFVNMIAKIYCDSQHGIYELYYYLEALKRTPKVLYCLDKVPANLDELTDQEIEMIVKCVAAGVSTDYGKAADIVSHSLDWIYATHNLFNTVKKI